MIRRDREEGRQARADAQARLEAQAQSQAHLLASNGIRQNDGLNLGFGAGIPFRFGQGNLIQPGTGSQGHPTATSRSFFYFSK
jgi:hypothetical protein